MWCVGGRWGIPLVLTNGSRMRGLGLAGGPFGFAALIPKRFLMTAGFADHIRGIPIFLSEVNAEQT